MEENNVVLTPEQEEAVAKHKLYLQKMADIFSECWEDEDFKARFVREPAAVLQEYGVEVEEGVEYVVIEAPVRTQYCVLPHENAKEAMQAVTNFLSQSVEEKDNFLPEGWEMRILQNTAEKRFLVLPFSPEELTPEELEMVTGGGFFVGKVFIVAHTVLIAMFGVIHSVGAVVAAAVAAAAAAVVAAVVV